MFELYIATDGNAEIEIFADTPAEAAQEYVDGGGWHDTAATWWVDVRVCKAADREAESSYTIAIEPTEPACCHDQGHSWRSPHSALAGIHENPGVWGHGGGVVITEVCRHCARYRDTDTWAHRTDTGEQGLTSTEYRDSDETSQQWAHRKAQTL